MRYFIGILVAIGLIVVIFIIILRSVTQGPTTSISQPLVNYANTSTEVQMIIDGPINANQDHYQLQMTVGQNQSSLILYNGYQGQVAKSYTYANNSASYGEFLRALDLAGFTQGNTSKTADNDPRGFCPEGERYTFEIVNGSQDIQRFWATSCGGQGTFNGNVVTVKNLFMAQMPDFENIISNTDLY